MGFEFVCDFNPADVSGAAASTALPDGWCQATITISSGSSQNTTTYTACPGHTAKMGIAIAALIGSSGC